MYLDDLIRLSPGLDKAREDHKIVKDLLHELGLPEAQEKSQPLAQVIRWLGIQIDAKNMRLSIPIDKVRDTLGVVNKYRNRRSMSRKELQSPLAG